VTSIRIAVVVVALGVAAVGAHPGIAHADNAVPVGGPNADDIIDVGDYPPQDGPTLELAGSVTVDPLGLIPYPDEVRRYSTGTDVFEVWSCPDAGTVPVSLPTFVADAETRMTAYFQWLSDGRYDPDFIAGGVVPGPEASSIGCAAYARRHTTGSSRGALFIRAGSGGYATPGFWCGDFSGTCPTTYPDNAREGYVGVSSMSWSTVAHEMGHMLSWPHSFTGATSSQYDNAIDLMSGNFRTWEVGNTVYWGTYEDPYATIAINRYRAGWIDPKDVVVWDHTDTTTTLRSIGHAGDQALVIDEGSRYVVLGPRIASSNDPFPAAWNGVEMYTVDRCSTCYSLDAVATPTPPVPFVASDLKRYEKPLDHVLGVGRSYDLCATRISVVSGTTSSYTIRVDPVGATGFTDVCGDDAFSKEIRWLADTGTTKGCNPPENTEFCPDALVSRAQMAAFLVRALGYTADGGGNLFTDDDTSIFESDIDKLATAGVTYGCNPPANDEFCPNQFVTRGQMAAFLYRALH